ncbi:MAG: excinuclease ABC subunit UvrC, partial [Alphaproteobacteria bacterium]|nr:excinuclease ABC subunit UvrC [Alphaproteobacteria bacterium]
SDLNFANRTKPCMQYQIKRCSAPCIGYITHHEYIKLVSQAKAFLAGQSSKIIKETATKMENASKNLDFEKAAVFRDRINALRQIHGHKTPAQASNADVIAIKQTGGQSCIHIFFFRGGYSCGNCSFFPSQAKGADENVILEAFVSQFYSRHTPPLEIILNISLPNQELIHKALEQKLENKIKITVPIRGNKKKLVEQVLVNAKEALARRFADKATQKQLMNKVAETFELPFVPSRIEVFDNSHIQGTNAVGCMIAAGQEGFIKSSYRKFNIRNTVGDDYGMMREVFTRRFTKITKDNTPDIVLIDGGRGHLNVVLEVFSELKIKNITAIAISKGRDRNAGKELFHCQNKETFSMPFDDSVLYFLQRLRDEAHRFAIGSHRAKRLKDIYSSPLDNIPRIGAKRKKALLHHFGSARAVSDAGIDDLNAVDGINAKIAKNIYDYFHSSS